MNKLKMIVASAVIVGSIAGVIAAVAPEKVHAIVGNTNNAQCRLDAKTPVVYNAETKQFENLGKNFTYNADKTKATGTFVVSGTDPNCKKDVTLASWKMPKSFEEAGYQLEDQKLYDYTIKRQVGRGTHTITVDLPQCSYWQIDMLEGTQPTGDDGTADYGFGKAHMLDTVMGQHKCEEPEVCPHDPTMDKDDPNCKPPVTPEEEPCPYDSTMDKDDPNCKPPVTPETPTTPVSTEKAPVTTVPNTGAGSILATTFGISTSAGLAYNLFEARRKFLK